MKPIYFPIMLLTVFAVAVGYADRASSQGSAVVRAPTTQQEVPRVTARIRISFEGAVLTGTLNDSRAAQDFAAMLPITLTLADYNSTEKISDLPSRLSREGAPAGIAPTAGDIAYYAPWGNLAIFYRGFRHSPGLISLGRIDEGIEALRQPGPITARIERLPE
jgi:hypothetical protein